MTILFVCYVPESDQSKLRKKIQKARKKQKTYGLIHTEAAVNSAKKKGSDNYVEERERGRSKGAGQGGLRSGVTLMLCDGCRETHVDAGRGTRRRLWRPPYDTLHKPQAALSSAKK